MSVSIGHQGTRRAFGRGESSARLSIAVCILLIAAIVVPVVVYRSWYSVANGRFFHVKTVEVAGNNAVTEEQILFAAGLDVPRNALTLDEGEMERAVAGLPMVASADVDVDVRGRVLISVREAQPAAIAVAGDVFLVSAEGELLRPLRADDSLDLPTLVGLGTAASGYAEVDAEAVGDALEIYDAYGETLSSRFNPAREIHFDTGVGFRMILDDGTEVRIGFDRYQERVARFAEVERILAEGGLAAEYVATDVSRLDRVPVRLRGFSRTIEVEAGQ